MLEVCHLCVEAVFLHQDRSGSSTMNLQLLSVLGASALCVLFTGCSSPLQPADSTTAADSRGPASSNQWFAGMRTSLGVRPALPSNFIVVSASPGAKGTKEFDMYDGNIWAPARTAKQFEYGGEKSFAKAAEPLFFVHLSSNVAQDPATGRFTHEKDLEANFQMMGVKHAKSARTKWGDYPVLSLTGERPDGSPVFVAWMGFNSPDGWTVLIDYRVPKGGGHPTREEQQIWERFLRDTKVVK